MHLRVFKFGPVVFKERPCESLFKNSSSKIKNAIKFIIKINNDSAAINCENVVRLVFYVKKIVLVFLVLAINFPFSSAASSSGF